MAHSALAFARKIKFVERFKAKALCATIVVSTIGGHCGETNLTKAVLKGGSEGSGD